MISSDHGLRNTDVLLTLRVVFKSKNDEQVRVLTDTYRESSDSKSAQNFAFSTDSGEEYIFRGYEELLEVKNSIVRVLNRKGLYGEEFDENMENTKDCVRMIRTYLSMHPRYTVEFQIGIVNVQIAGNFAISIRSDML